MKSFFAGLLLSSLAIASNNDLVHRPKSFSVAGGKAVFVDFTEAKYNITYDLTKKTASVKAEIKFHAPESGKPIFDLVEAPASVILDGQIVASSETKTPNRETTLRIIDKSITVGAHSLIIETPLKALVDFQTDGVKSAFWTSDLSERQFLERYMPANFEFDQVKMSFLVNFIGQKSKQLIYTNGYTEVLGPDSYRISYPDYYTASSIFFHTVPANSVNEVKFSIKSIDGRELPAVVYASKSVLGSGSTATLERLKNNTIKILQELESDYGAFPHPWVIVYNAGAGGMEYCGATMTDAGALGHELFHSYFARGVMPANGNSGWLDEALASWRDSGYPSISQMSGSSRMSSHPYYTRTTDKAAYTFGARFMAFLDNKLKEKGGLKPFMRYMVDQKVFAPLFVEEFIQEMNQFYGVSMSEDFKKFTFGSKNLFTPTSSEKHREKKYHHKLTVEELYNYL